QVMEKISSFAKFCEAFPAFAEASQQFEEILSFMKTLELTYYEQKMLKDELFKARKPVWDKQKELQIERENKEKEIESQKRQKVQTFRSSLEELMASSSFDVEEMVKRRDQLA